MKPILRFVLPVFLVTHLLSPARADETTATSNEWPAIVEQMIPLGERLVPRLSDPNDPRARQELYRLLAATAVYGYFGGVYADTEHPDF